ncbi:MAG: aminotransferase class I/II-fold pyridoxal phosphate-dependent enzyme [Clostridiales bacterium]|jgi:LL-diaminopimelate aminotransferase|nr:aminotransferase class I/II-fold pyridoxal phosphate-dependent enzyme [Clostridiales bacterium]
MKINSNFDKLTDDYLFATINTRVQEYLSKDKNAPLFRLGIGDIIEPLQARVIQTMVNKSREMGVKESFKGYCEYSGYPFLKQKVIQYYNANNIPLDCDDVFISDGAKSQLSLLLDLFDKGISVCVPNPVYPVYVDTNVLKGNKVVYIDGNKSNNFLPIIETDINFDIIYLCNPNNPTGQVYNKAQLEHFVQYALKNECVIFYDAAYEAFIFDDEEFGTNTSGGTPRRVSEGIGQVKETTDNTSGGTLRRASEGIGQVKETTDNTSGGTPPKSIYEINGAKQCAIEICSLSKTAGFTGLRCGYTILPKQLNIGGVELHTLFKRLLALSTNGVSYISQCAAATALDEENVKQNRLRLSKILQNTKIISDALNQLGVYHCGGVCSPYVWMQTPNGVSSWEFFDLCLSYGVVLTPGCGFGTSGEGFCRLSGFAQREEILQAVKVFKKIF